MKYKTSLFKAIYLRAYIEKHNIRKTQTNYYLSTEYNIFINYNYIISYCNDIIKKNISKLAQKCQNGRKWTHVCTTILTENDQLRYCCIKCIYHNKLFLFDTWICKSFDCSHIVSPVPKNPPTKLRYLTCIFFNKPIYNI